MKEKLPESVDKNIGAVATKALEFIEKLIGAPIMEITGTLTDKINYWRFKNKINTIIKAKAFMESKGLTPKSLMVKDIMSLLEFASFEDNESMQDRWASLLAHAADPDRKFSLCATFSQILNQLSSHEVYMLDYMFDKFYNKEEGIRKFVAKEYLLKLRFNSESVSKLIFENLIRLRLVEFETPKIDYNIEEEDFNDEESTNIQKKLEIKASDNIRLSEFAVEFISQTKY